MIATRLLARPAFSGAVALLAVNDHVLKERFPGWWTGKLSDVAGVFILTVLAAVVTRRADVAVGSTVIGFTALKLARPVALVVSPMLGGVARQDPTDLVALVAVVPAYIFVRKEIGLPRASYFSVRSILAGASALVAVLAITATSCLSVPVVGGFALQDGQVFALVNADPDLPSATSWAVSDDGGHSWTASKTPVSALSTSDEVCFEGRCLRVVRRARVVEIRGQQPPRTVFSFSKEEVRRMDKRVDCGIGRIVDLGPIVSVPRADGIHVLVAAGPQGVLHRTPSGVWERRGVLESEPIATNGPSWLADLARAPLLMALLGVFLALATRRRASWPGSDRAALLNGAAAILLLMAWAAADVSGVDYVISGPVIASLSVLVFIASLIAARRLAPSRGPVRATWPVPPVPGETKHPGPPLPWD